MQKYRNNIFAYLAAIFFVAGWWVLAFKQASHRDGEVHRLTKANQPKSKLRFSELTISTMDRSLLRQALAGDFRQMAKFIIDWDIDARLLQSVGMDRIKRLPSTEFLRSQILVRQILMHENCGRHMAQGASVLDAAGETIDLTADYQKFLPQTYAAASFLLAIAPFEQIVALPKRLREQVELYPRSLTDQIPLDIDRYNGEKLYQAQPEIAFIARYSHPSTIQALQNQGVVLYTMGDLTTFQDIQEELMRFGSIVNRQQEAEMLKIFIDAAMLALDNKQQLLIHHYEQNQAPIPKMLVLNYHQNFTAPAKGSLTGQILTRLPLFDITTTAALSSATIGDWMVPIEKERLIHLDPDCIIIATDNDTSLERELLNDVALQKLSAIKNQHLYFVDEAIHHSPTQFAVLAYHDLISALENLP